MSVRRSASPLLTLSIVSFNAESFQQGILWYSNACWQLFFFLQIFLKWRFSIPSQKLIRKSQFVSNFHIFEVKDSLCLFASFPVYIMFVCLLFSVSLAIRLLVLIYYIIFILILKVRTTAVYLRHILRAYIYFSHKNAWLIKYMVER